MSRRRISATFGVWIISVSLAGCATGGRADVTSSAPAPAAGSAAPNVIIVSGYPLDRTMKGLVEFPGVEAIVVLDQITKGQPHWTTPDGKAPVVGQTRSGADAGFYIVTPFEGTVVEALRGDLKVGTRVTMELVGGRVGDTEVRSGDEISPPMSSLEAGGRILVAGELQGTAVSPGFVYAISSDGTSADSLLKSGSNDKAAFGMDELRTTLKSKP